MKLLAYIVAYPLLWLISVLPFPLLYLLSDIVFVLIYYVIGYRRKTVRQNLALTLRHLDAAERKVVERKFYRHFCDNFLEMIKTMSISQQEMKKRFVFENIELVHELEAKGKSVAVLCGHYASYEWLLYMNTLFTTHKGYGIYKKINNPYFDRLVRNIRAKFHAELIDMKEAVPVMKANKRTGILGFYGFLTDQSPKIWRVPYWGTFFGMEVPVHAGAELLAKKMDMNVMFVTISKTGRGYYRARFILFEGEPKEVPNFEIMDAFLRILEQQIIDAPQYYLWTHKRFKHRRNDPPTA